MDLKDTIEHIGELAAKAAGAGNKVHVIQSLPGEPAGVYGIVTADGKFQRVVAAQGPRRHALHSIDQVVPLVEDVKARYKAACVVWYSATAVIVLIGDDKLDADLRPRATVPLAYSPEWAILLNELKTPQARDPKAFVQFVRTKLLDALVDAERLIPYFRNLQSRVQQNTHARTGLGRESLGAEIDAEITSDEGDLPDYLVFSMPVFNDVALQTKTSVRCALDVDPRSMAIRLDPIESDLVTGLQNQVTSIGNIFTTTLKNVPVFFGSPDSK